MERSFFKRFIKSVKPKLKYVNIFFNVILVITGLLGMGLMFDQYYQSDISENVISFVSDQEVEDQRINTKYEPVYANLSGQVTNPGVYEVERYETVFDLIQKAGGLTANVNDDFVHKCLNLSEKVSDQQKIYLPANNEEYPCNNNSFSEQGMSQNSIDDANIQNDLQKININSANISELDNLPGVGPATAEKIILARPYRSVEQLLEVKGIGEKTLEKIRPYATL